MRGSGKWNGLMRRPGAAAFPEGPGNLVTSLHACPPFVGGRGRRSSMSLISSLIPRASTTGGDGLPVHRGVEISSLLARAFAAARLREGGPAGASVAQEPCVCLAGRGGPPVWPTHRAESVEKVIEMAAFAIAGVCRVCGVGWDGCLRWDMRAAGFCGAVWIWDGGEDESGVRVEETG